MNRLINGTSASAAKLMNIVNTLGNIQDTCISAAGVVDDVLLIVEELLELHNETAALLLRQISYHYFDISQRYMTVSLLDL